MCHHVGLHFQGGVDHADIQLKELARVEKNPSISELTVLACRPCASGSR